MHERRKEKEELTGWAGEKLDDPEATFTNFPDWNNPEDDDDAPEGYYDDEDEEDEVDDDSYIPDENDPDYDLSEAAGYAGYGDPRTDIVPQWMLKGFVIVVVLAIILGFVLTLR